MRVLMTADAVGGVWTYALGLARGLARWDTHVTLAVMGAPPGPDRVAEAAAHRNITLVHRGFRLEWMRDPWADVAAAGDWLLELERTVRPDAIHLNGYAHAALPWSGPVLVVAHSCVCSWWRAVPGRATPDEWQQYRDAVGKGLRAARLVVAPTRAMLESLALEHGTVARSRVIPNGCDQAPLPFGTRDAFGRYPRRPPRSHAIVLAAGRVWDEAKNLRTLAAAAPAIRWPVCIAGPRERPEGGGPRLDGVDLLGPLPRAALQRWYRRASIFAHPALYEPFGLAPLEAAHAGAALVLGDIPSLREVWGDAAVYVPPREPAALAEAINRLVDRPPLLAEYAASARERAQRYGVAAMARSYQAAYGQLTTRGVDVPEEALACAS
jgi:glycogen synthase